MVTDGGEKEVDIFRCVLNTVLSILYIDIISLPKIHPVMSLKDCPQSDKVGHRELAVLQGHSGSTTIFQPDATVPL